MSIEQPSVRSAHIRFPPPNKDAGFTQTDISRNLRSSPTTGFVLETTITPQGVFPRFQLAAVTKA